MFLRVNQAVVADFLSWSPAVGILGARQVGKSFAVREFAKASYENFFEVN